VEVLGGERKGEKEGGERKEEEGREKGKGEKGRGEGRRRKEEKGTWGSTSCNSTPVEPIWMVLNRVLFNEGTIPSGSVSVTLKKIYFNKQKKTVGGGREREDEKSVVK
jgi:hypothetical protein